MSANPRLAFLVIFSSFLSIVPLSRPVAAQDLVATEDLAGGSSVFVFRESRKRPQSRAAGGRVSLAGGGRVSAVRSNAQIAAANQKRRAAAIAARKKMAAAAANRKLALSNTLTAKAETFLDNNQTDLAITNYREALVQNPKNTRASDGLSNALTGKGIDAAGETNSEAAIAIFEEAIKHDLKNDVAYAKLGAIYEARGLSSKAVTNYEKALALNPDYSTLHAPLGKAYLDGGEIAKAEASFQRAEAAGADGAELGFMRGLVFFKQNKNDEALAAFDKALEVDPRNAPAQYYRAQIHERNNRSAESIAALKRTLEIDPTYSAASFDLGVNYYNAGDYPSAAAAYENTVNHDPNNHQAHANLASSYRQLERFADANAEYKLASIGIKTPDLYSEWGYCLGKVAEWEKALERLKSAQEMSPSAIDNSNLGWAHYNAANTQKAAKNDAAAQSNYALAKQFLDIAVKQDSRLDAAYLNLGSTHNALGEFQLAVDILKTVLTFKKDWSLAANQLGLGYRGLKDFTNAIAVLKRVTDLDGKNTYGLFNLGEAYFASGNKKEAQKIHDKLKKLDPALSQRLNNVLSGKAVVDAAKQKVDQVVPKIPRLPRFP